ncbi:MAG: hypothetical protein FXF54_01580 [Kosmotoga sp.]|nr:MAG: hypothetical protein FXF54_01580 [Kosmotoga sp.]
MINVSDYNYEDFCATKQKPFFFKLRKVSIFFVFLYYFFNTFLNYLGYINVISIPSFKPLFFLALLVCLANFTEFKKLSLSRKEFFLFTIIIFGLFLFPIFSDYVSIINFMEEYIFGFINPFLLVALGFLFGKIINNKFIYLFLILMFVEFVLFVYFDYLYRFDMLQFTRISGAFNHGVADNLIIASILAIVITKKTLKLLIIILSIFAIAFTGSFSSFVFYMITFGIFLTIDRRKKLRLPYIRLRNMIFLTIIFLAIFLLIILGYLEPFFYSISSLIDRLTRVVEMKDLSLKARIFQFEVGFKIISENILVGSWNYYIPILGEGNYMHNVFSWWANYGLSTFLSIIGLIFLSFIKLNRFMKTNYYVISEALFYVLLFVFLQMLFVRSHTYSYIWLILGIILGHTNKLKESTG